jgi:hypothetical protein
MTLFLEGAWCKVAFFNAVLFGQCKGLNICAPPNSYVEILVPQVMVLGDGAFGWWLGNEGGILACIKKWATSTILLSFHKGRKQ